MNTLKPIRVPRQDACPNNVTGAKGWCWKCYANMRGRGSNQGHRFYRAITPPYVPYTENIMQRPTQSEAQSAEQTGCPDETLVKDYPLIVAYLTDGKWDDGKARETSALSITVQDGVIQVALNDKALKASMYTSAGTLKAALRLMEGALKDGKATWRAWKRGK